MSISAKSGNSNTSHRIPKAPFIADIDEFLKEKDLSAEAAIKELDELYSKYRFM
jgi:hypothetical protein